MIGGRLIEIRPMRIIAGDYPGRHTDVVRLWCTDKTGQDDIAVYAEPADVMPRLGDEIWWQSRQIMFNGDRCTLRKVGTSFRPSEAAP